MSCWRLAQAKRYIDAGGIVAYPTEAVYGLGCDPLDAAAAMRLLEIKHRPLELGMILIGARLDHLAPYIGDMDRKALDRCLRTWPGPHTWLVPASAMVPPWIRGAHATVAVRVTAHPVAAALCKAVGGTIVSTSANVHGAPPARSAWQVRLRLGDAVDFVVGGATGRERRPTAIREALTGRTIRAA